MYFILKRDQSGPFAHEIYSESKQSDPIWSETLRQLRILQIITTIDLPDRTVTHDKKKILGDMLYSPPLLAANQTVKSIMLDTKVNAQYLPFQMASTKGQFIPYFYIDLVNKKHVLNLEKSEYEKGNLSKKINSVMRVYINNENDYGPMVRCLDSKLIFVKDSLVQRFKDEGITGVEFCPIDEFSGRP